jgi:hypothetical protein
MPGFFSAAVGGTKTATAPPAPVAAPQEGQINSLGDNAVPHLAQRLAMIISVSFSNQSVLFSCVNFIPASQAVAP